ncbi:hypothetical protein QTN25_003917 [Entamoeba marina]
MNIAWEEYQSILKHHDQQHRSATNVFLWAFGQIAVEIPNEFTHRINILFLLLMIKLGSSYIGALIGLSVIVLLFSVFGGLVNLVIVTFSYVVVVISTLYLLLVIGTLWSFHISTAIVLLFFSAWLPQASVALHGSQVPFACTIDLHKLADHLSILMTTITNFLIIFLMRIFPDLDYFDENAQALSKMDANDIERPTGIFIMGTVMCVIGLVLLVPYLFLREHKTKPPIKSIGYNTVFVFNEFKTFLQDIFREKSFFIITLLLLNKIFSFFTSLISVVIVPPILHWVGPRICIVVLLAFTSLLICAQQITLFVPWFGYFACVFCGLASASMNVTIRRFIYENCTYESISLHYGVVAIVMKIISSVTVLLTIIYQFQENEFFYTRYFGVTTVYFVLCALGSIAALFMNDHHKDYKNGLRPPYVKIDIVETKD